MCLLTLYRCKTLTLCLKVQLFQFIAMLTNFMSYSNYFADDLAIGDFARHHAIGSILDSIASIQIHPALVKDGGVLAV